MQGAHHVLHLHTLPPSERRTSQPYGATGVELGSSYLNTGQGYSSLYGPQDWQVDPQAADLAV